MVGGKVEIIFSDSQRGSCELQSCESVRRTLYIQMVVMCAGVQAVCVACCLYVLQHHVVDSALIFNL